MKEFKNNSAKMPSVIMKDDFVRLKYGAIDITIPLDDPETYKLLSSGDTSGVFMMEGKRMQKFLAKLQPSRIEDIVAAIAIHMPGHPKKGVVKELMKRRRNPSFVTYETSELEKVLGTTYGMIIYQEQIVEIAVELAGFSIEDGYSLRRALSRKNPYTIDRYKEKFIKGASVNNILTEKSEKVFNMLVSSHDHTFSRFYSIAFAVIAYQTAHLKVHREISKDLTV